MAKKRLSVSVDAYLVEEGQAAVAAGLHDSLSGWVSAALRQQSAHDRRLRAADEFIAAWEAEYGVITEEDMERAHRDMMARAITVEFPDDEPSAGSSAADHRRSA